MKAVKLTNSMEQDMQVGGSYRKRRNREEGREKE